MDYTKNFTPLNKAKQETPLKSWVKKKWGRGTRLAEAMGCTRQYVCMLGRPEKVIPSDVCPVIEQVTGIPCEVLRPDVRWDLIRPKKHNVPLTETAEGS